MAALASHRRWLLLPWLGAAAAIGLLPGCRAKLEARVSGSSDPEGAGGPIVRVFAVESPAGLQVDAATSGLGLDIVIPQDVSATQAFQLAVTAAPPDGETPLFLELASDEVESFERPATVEIPAALLPAASAGAVLVVKDRTGVRRVVAPEALTWAEGKVAVTTSQPMGQWAFAAGSEADAAGYLVITTTGLESGEAMRYEVKLLQQRYVSRGYQVRLPEQVVHQRVAGNETRYVSAPTGALGRYLLTVLEAPATKQCQATTATGSSRGRVPVLITCTGR